VREWYFFTDRATVWRVIPGSWKADALIAFVFEHKPQDVDRFRHERKDHLMRRCARHNGVAVVVNAWRGGA
jgi:hypothetical protein